MRDDANAPYRYAGQRWWQGEFDFGGADPDQPETWSKQPGFEKYHSAQFLRAAQQDAQAPHYWTHGKAYPVGGALEKLRTGLPGEVDQAFDGRDRALSQAIEVMNLWAQDMIAWAKAVREDLLALEARVGQQGGDPGEPPPVPWK